MRKLSKIKQDILDEVENKVNEGWLLTALEIVRLFNLDTKLYPSYKPFRITNALNSLVEDKLLFIKYSEYLKSNCYYVANNLPLDSSNKK